ncbi:MAG TPA: PTS transporter subunit EIIC, partial [Erysipelothrix sp.]
MNKKSSKFWAFMQSLGRTFMLPVALLAAMGILLGIGSGLSGATTVEMFPFLGNSIIQAILGFMVSVSLVAFSFLPLLFAIAIPLGMAKDNKEIAAFAGVVGFIAMHLGTNFYLNNTGLIETVSTQTIMGIESIDTGVLGALASGVLVYKIHEKFQYTKLPDSFAFFGGTRFV